MIVSEKTLLRIAAGALLFVPILRAACTPLWTTHFPISFLTPFRIDTLCAGALIAVITRRDPNWPATAGRGAWAGFALAAGVLGGLSRYPWFHTGTNTVASNSGIYTLTLLIGTALLVIALSGGGWMCSFLRFPPLV